MVPRAAELLLCQMIKHSCEHRDGAGSGSGGFQDFGSFRACCAGGEDIIDDKDALALDGLGMRDGKSTALVFESLLYGYSLLGSCLRCSLEQMDVAVDVQSRCQFMCNDPCRIEIADKSLPPMLRDRHNPVD